MTPFPPASDWRKVRVLLVLLGAAGGCTRGAPAPDGPRRPLTVIQTRGSDSMSHVASLWAEEYGKVAPEVEVEVSGGGSATGFTALVEGSIEIANSSRPIHAKEAETIRRRHPDRPPYETVVGYDALAVFVHEKNPLEEISLQQLHQIYAEGGTITRWSQLGVTLPRSAGDDIVLVSRQSNSGTYEFFREHVLDNEDFRPSSHELNGSKDVVALVAVTPGAIGFGGMGYVAPGVKMLRVRAKDGQPAYAPTVQNTVSHLYPLSRPLFLYTLGEPRGATKAYVDWVLSDAGQRVVETSGYVPLPPARRSGPRPTETPDAGARKDVSHPRG